MRNVGSRQKRFAFSPGSSNTDSGVPLFLFAAGRDSLDN